MFTENTLNLLKKDTFFLAVSGNNLFSFWNLGTL